MHEPFVGYARISDRHGAETKLLICRHYAPFDFQPRHGGVDFASYLSHLGRIIAKRPGQDHRFQVTHPTTGIVLEDHEFRLLEKDEFTPHLENGAWDAINNQIAWIEGLLFARSLRKLLEGETEQKQIRQLRYSVQLPDQAILDQVQDEIFRLPLQARIRISGAPGTGKTTVLLKRLSQKTKREFLTEDELKAIRNEDWQEGRNWMLFTPSDLLKSYLKEAMAKELLPASDEHVKVYRTFRLELLRDVGFIRVGQHGFFRAAPENLQLMKRTTGGEQVALAKAFGKFLVSRYSAAFREALQKFNNATRVRVALLSDAAQKVLNVALDILSKQLSDVIALQQAQQRAAGYRKLNEDLNRMLSALRSIAALYDENNEIPLNRIYRQARLFPSVLESLTTTDIDVALFPEIPPVLEGLRHDLRDLNESLSLTRLFQLIPRSYQQFREAPDEQKRFFHENSEKPIRERMLSEPEQDVILFQALQFLRDIADDLPPDLSGVPGEIRAVLARMRLIVCVDEVTDFSPLEIACIERFAKLGAGGVTVCGDLMQRVTEQGLKEWSDLDATCEKYEGRELRISYRQTERLFSIAKDLYRHACKVEPERLKSISAHFVENETWATKPTP